MTGAKTSIRIASVDEGDLGLSSLDGGEFEVVDVEDAAECLDAVEAREIDCVVSEATLPETNPLDLFERLREDHPDLPFVLLAREVDEGALREAIEAGVTDYVPADVSPEALARRLRECVGAREAAERYHSLFEASHAPIVLVDAEGVIRSCNEGYCGLVGAESAEALEGELACEFVHPEDRARVEQRLTRIFDGGAALDPIELRLQSNGESRYVRGASAPGRYRGERVAQVVFTDITDLRRTERELREERRFVESALDALQDVFYVVDTEREVLRWNERAVEVTGYSPEELAEMSIDEFVVGEDLERAMDSFQRVLEDGDDVVEFRILTKGGESIPFEFRGQRLTDEAGEVERVVGIGRDITDRRAWERDLARQQERLEALNATNEIIRDVNAALVTAETREQIERTVCEQFAGEGPYRFAWIGAPDQGHNRIVPRTWAGVERGYLDTLEITIDESATGQGPAGLAVRTGEVQTMSVHDPAFTPWREAAQSRGYESVVGIPITYSEVDYGVLVLYGDHVEGLEYLEEDVLGELGRTIGYAINAAERKRALLADAVVELDLSVCDSTEFFCRFSDTLDCPVSLEKVTRQNDGTYNVFLTIETDDDRIDEVCRQFQSIAACRHLSSHGGAQTVELQVTETLIVDLLATHGSVVGSLTAEDGACELTVELPSTIDIRSLIETLQSTYSDVELLARRERSGQERPQLGLRLEELLTDRQQEVLETAYFAGYFEETRASSGTDIAELLGISGPTFHHHLRTSHRRLLAELLGPRNG